MRRLIFLSLVLAGCVSPQERAARQAAYMEKLQGQCYAYGFRNGQDMANCVMNLDAMKRANDAAASAAALNASQFFFQQGTPQPIGTRCYTTQTGPITQQTVCR